MERRIVTRSHDRWALSGGPAWILLVVAFLLPAGQARGRAGGSEEYDRPSEAWREGPVRYLLTKDEDDAFRALASDEARAAFIQRFWAMRDPRPDTLENEYRTLFYRRVAEANRFFMDSPKAGWKTDQGKIYILLGPPDEKESLGDSVSGREAMVWTYRTPPAGLGLGPRSAIRFVKDSSGEFRLSSNILRSGRETSLAVGLQVQAMQMKSLPEPRQVLDSIMTSRSFLDSGPMRTHRDFFRSADGNTFTVVTVGLRQGLITRGELPGAPASPAPSPSPEAASSPSIPPGPAPPPSAAAPPDGARGPAGSAGSRFEVMARMAGEGAGTPSYDLAGQSGLREAREDAGAGPRDDLLFQGAITVKPGPYTAYYGVIDHETNRIYSFKEAIEVPDLKSDTLALSSVTLASSLERLPGDTAPGYSTPFVMGNLRVLPRPDDQFRNGETFAFYYQVYGPAIDPIAGRPDFEIEYQFYVARSVAPNGEPGFEPLGRPIRLTRQQSQVQGYSFPLKDWPAATYRLRVLVTDSLNGRTASREVTFRVL